MRPLNPRGDSSARKSSERRHVRSAFLNAPHYCWIQCLRDGPRVPQVRLEWASVISCVMEKRKNQKWEFFIVFPAGMVLLLDNGTDMDDENSFVLLKTLVRHCSVKTMFKDLRAIRVEFTNSWAAFRGGVAISFLFSLWLFRSILVGRSGSGFSNWLQVILIALSRIGCCSVPHVGPISICFLPFHKHIRNFNVASNLNQCYGFSIQCSVSQEMQKSSISSANWFDADGSVDSEHPDDASVLSKLIKDLLNDYHESSPERELLLRNTCQFLQ